MNKAQIKIGLFGFGCVGKGLYDVLSQVPTLNAEIVKIAIKDPSKPRAISQKYFTTDRDEILNNPSINTIVELIDDADAAFEIVKEALRRGIAVVTANKKMIAEHLSELLALQEQYGTPLLYEGSCCASIPIIRNLEEYYDNDLLTSIHGIVNGSTNYILTQTATEGISYQEALEDAQDKGYAESNPLLDVGGYDAKYKLMILLLHSFGIVTRPDDIFHIGIDALSKLPLAYAREKGYKVKLIATATINEDGAVIAFVMPRFVKPNELIHNVDNVYNAVELTTSFSETQFFKGKGAGAFPTASAVLSDLSALQYQYKYEYKKLRNDTNITLAQDTQLKVMVSGDKALIKQIGSLFHVVSETLYTEQEAYIIGVLSLSSIQYLCAGFGKELSFVYFDIVPYNSAKATEEVSEEALALAIND